VIAGSFAAHGLEGRFEELYRDLPPKLVAGKPVPAAQKYLNDFRTGADYQFWHALGILLVASLLRDRNSRWLEWSARLMTIGIVLFSGLLYLLTLLAMPKFGMIAPIGGTAMILGWLCLAIGLCPCRKTAAE
ncbi:MAG: DUF423 domain-containing protein, partial [Planctomycetaceae bacterium]|nr:DUF423 domain-containing protein [Planctomycetaceae bacterium]